MFLPWQEHGLLMFSQIVFFAIMTSEVNEMDFEEKVTNVEHLFDGKVIDLDRETVMLPNGKEAA